LSRQLAQNETSRKASAPGPTRPSFKDGFYWCPNSQTTRSLEMEEIF